MKRLELFAAVALVVAAVLLDARSPLVARRQQVTTVIAYGDTRFTDPSNTTATNPQARHALIAQIADEHPDAIVIGGDLPWHGGTAADYDAFRTETATWRERHLRVLPSLGNHEFSQCDPDVCLEHWWTAFPELRGRRWYGSDIGPTVRSLALDTMSSLLPGSDQRLWLEHELTTLPKTVQFVLVVLHHPPVADIQTRLRVDHNPRPNEIALRDSLKTAAQASTAKLVVIAGHVHNYERFFEDGIVYLVSGGGGAVPYEVDRTEPDLYQTSEFPNYHYVKMTIEDGHLTGQMYRLDEASAPSPHFTLKDTFEMHAR